jgi:hypothetical protein
VWDVVIVTACLEHECLLIDDCPHEGAQRKSRIPVVRLYPDLCRCGDRLSNARSEPLDAWGLAMQARFSQLSTVRPGQILSHSVARGLLGPLTSSRVSHGFTHADQSDGAGGVRDGYEVLFIRRDVTDNPARPRTARK